MRLCDVNKMLDLMRKFYSDRIAYYTKYHVRIQPTVKYFKPQELFTSSVIADYPDAGLSKRSIDAQSFRELVYKAQELTEMVADDIPVHVIVMPPVTYPSEGFYSQYETVHRRAIVTVGRELVYPVFEGYAVIKIPGEVSFWDFLRKDFREQLELLAFKVLKWRGYFGVPTN